MSRECLFATGFIPHRSPRISIAVAHRSRASYRKIFGAIYSGNVIDGAALGELRSLICETLKVQDVLLCGSGSLALELALLACEVRHGDEVVLPSFCCSAVVPPVVAVGATPVLADVGAELNVTATSIDAVLTRKTKAIIVPHLFGNTVDIAAIVELARSRNITVIDDAAQALGATIDGHPAGSFGDAGILSFCGEKICSGLGGGALVFRDRRMFGEKLLRELARPSLSSTAGELFSTILWRHWRRLHEVRSRNTDPGAPPKPYQRKFLANLNAVVAVNSIKTLDKNLAARRARVHAYQTLLGGDKRLHPIAHRPRSACLTQVVRVLPQKRGVDLALRVIGALSEAGFEVQGSYVPIHLLASFGNCVWDRLPHTDRVWADLIELPCEPSIDITDIERIAAIIKKVADE